MNTLELLKAARRLYDVIDRLRDIDDAESSWRALNDPELWDAWGQLGNLLEDKKPDGR